MLYLLQTRLSLCCCCGRCYLLLLLLSPLLLFLDEFFHRGLWLLLHRLLNLLWNRLLNLLWDWLQNWLLHHQWWWHILTLALSSPFLVHSRIASVNNISWFVHIGTFLLSCHERLQHLLHLFHGLVNLVHILLKVAQLLPLII